MPGHASSGGSWSARARRALLVPALAAAPAALVSPAAAGQPWFADVTSSAGVGYVQQVPAVPPDCTFGQGAFCEPERMTGGAAVGDVDADGDLDLLVTRYGSPDILFCNRLAQTGSAVFDDCTAGSGLDLFALQSNGAVFADLDRDGDLDLYVGTLGDGDGVNDRSYLFMNDGSGQFTEEAVARGAAAAGALRRSWSVSAGDYDRDGWIDLHLTEWLPQQPSRGRLLHNTGGGFFEDRTDPDGANLDGIHGFATSFADLDGDLWPELIVAADFGTSRLLWNRGDGTFFNGTMPAGVGTEENGMGSALGDFDGDGDLDWFVTSIYDPDDTCATEACNWGITGNRLYRNDGGRTFTDVTDEFDVRDGRWGWGTSFIDHDNDADLDLVMTNGVDFPGSPSGAFVDDPMRFWENVGPGPWPEVAVSLGITDVGSGKGLLTWDYDADGDLDLLVINNASGALLYRNERGNENDWLRVHAQHAWGSAALGARVELLDAGGDVAQVQQIGASSGFLGQGERVAHFGLGPAAPASLSVRVHWPGGGEQLVTGLAPRSVVVVREARPVPLGIPLPLLALALLLGSGARWARRRHSARPAR